MDTNPSAAPTVATTHINESNTAAEAEPQPARFVCHLCQNAFSRGDHLQRHLRSHEDDRAFICTVCSKAFTRGYTTILDSIAPLCETDAPPEIAWPAITAAAMPIQTLNSTPAAPTTESLERVNRVQNPS